MNTFVVTIDLKLAPKIKSDLIEQGFELSKPQHTLFQAKKPGINCKLYTSGKLTVQGKQKDEWIEFYLEPLIGNFSYTHAHADVDLTPRIGIDEAGKGDFFGPLVIGGIYADEAGIQKLLKLGVNDSKRMHDRAVAKLADKLEREFPFATVVINPTKYNELYQSFNNLNRLLAWGHATAIQDLHKQTHCRNALIDQFANESVVELALKKKNIEIELEQRTKGEEDPVVAAASIIARAHFVKGIERLSRHYDMDLPKGASAQVVRAGKKLVARDGPGILSQVGKLHFKTKQDILQQTFI